MAGKKYVLAIDQSTQGTKGILFDAEGQLICRRDIAHEQIVNEKGWVSMISMRFIEICFRSCKMW